MKLSIEFLGKNAVFSHLQIADLKFLVRESVSRNYKKGERIAHYGDVWPYIFLVGKGKVTAVKESAEGRILTIVTIGPGEIFWGAAFFQEGLPNLAALIADEDCQVFLWSQERILPILLDNGRLSWELSGLLVDRMQRASDIVEELAFQPVAVRLAGFLIDYFKESESERVARDLTLDEIAARVGSTREVVSRILHRFANQGLIEITRTEFSFTDKDALRQLAQINGK
jgi:CRP/FNR family transcriptional regulator